MAKKRKDTRQPERTAGTVYDGDKPTLWLPLDDGTKRGRLTKTEETLIAMTPYPAKTAGKLDKEQKLRAARIDHSAKPDLVPMKTVSLRGGVAQLREGYLRQLAGDGAETEDDRRVRLLLLEYERTNPAGCALLRAHWEERRSIRDLAERAGVSARSIARMILLAELQVLERFQTLYPQST